MKILFITKEYPGIIGGIADYTFHLVNNLLTKYPNLEIFVLTSKDKSIITNNSVRVLPIIDKWNLFGIPSLINSIDNFQIDLVCLQYSPYMYNNHGLPFWLVIFAMLIKLKRIKLITTFHEISMKININPKNFFFGTLQVLIAFILTFASWKAIVTLKYWGKVLSVFKNKVVRIPIGSNIIPIKITDSEKNKLRQKIAPNKEIIISTFGSVNKFRKHEVLLEAARKILDSHKEMLFKIIFIGYSAETQQKELLEKVKHLNLESIVQFTGYMNSDDIYKYLSISDIFILLNTDDKGGIGMRSGAVVAAYAAGLPILGTKGPITDDFFKDGENVFFAKSISVKDIKDALLELITNSELRMKLSKGAEQTYKRKLEWGVIAEEYMEVLNLLRAPG